MDRRLLSICIPTYNRASWLEQIITKMLHVCIEKSIHIYISDNASPDNTEQVGIKFQSKYDFIHYFRHESNIGPDDNFEFVLKLSDTKYRWLMSDTCYVEDVDSMLVDLQNGEYDGYIVNAPRYRGQFLPTQKIHYSETISLMRDIGWHLSWISCMIYNEKLVNAMNFEHYKASSFNQTALMFETTAHRECNIVFNPNIIVYNLPSETKASDWHNHIFDIMYRRWYLMIMSLPLYYPYEVKLKCIEDNARNSNVLKMRFLLKMYIEGRWNVGDVYRNRFFIKQAKGNYKSLLTIGLCPRVFFVLAKIGVKSLKSLLSLNKGRPSR